jgi:hypothetical protein
VHNILHGTDLAGIAAQNKKGSRSWACVARLTQHRPKLRTYAILVGVLDHLNFGRGDQPLSNYFIEEWQQSLNFVL